MPTLTLPVVDDRVWRPTFHLRWAQVMVTVPSNYEGGPGTNKSQKQLQQAWETEDGDVEWRPVPTVD